MKNLKVLTAIEKFIEDTQNAKNALIETLETENRNQRLSYSFDLALLLTRLERANDSDLFEESIQKVLDRLGVKVSFAWLQELRGELPFLD